MSTHTLSRLILAVFFCSSFAMPLANADGAETQNAPKKAAVSKKAAAPKKATSTKPAASAVEPGHVVQQKLEQFVVSNLDSFNRNTLRSERKKGVTKNTDGSYTASYTHFDKNSIQCSYKETESVSPVKYVGKFSYMQVEYICTAPTEKAALTGPFIKKHQEAVTELAKYIGGKWTY